MAVCDAVLSLVACRVVSCAGTRSSSRSNCTPTKRDDTKCNATIPRVCCLIMNSILIDDFVDAGTETNHVQLSWDIFIDDDSPTSEAISSLVSKRESFITTLSFIHFIACSYQVDYCAWVYLFAIVIYY
mmetsp:Transcript_19401/g.40853  ORF Transcript_19401/g.40853 Transcript_19401/m.40853 type:complete len:129 (-) Transcript_19401:284-670(-)